MTFSALHRALGLAPEPFSDAMLDAAVDAQVEETEDLDWRSALPPAKGLSETDFPKDVAAMANSGGGVIVFGVREVQKAATERVDVGELSESHERALRNVAVTAVSPPIFGLNIHRLGDDARRAVIVEIPASVDGPHLIYRNDYFGAPVRNDADTVWMRERQIEAMYRARFDERRHATEALDRLHGEAAAGRDSATRAWFIAVAHPRVPRQGSIVTRDAARDIFRRAEGLALTYVGHGVIHPLDSVDRLNPRPGLRRWIAVNEATSEQSRWKEAWVSVHHDGSVTLAAAIGRHRSSHESYYEGWQIESSAIECAVADFMGTLRAAAEATANNQYEVRVGIEWTAEQALSIFASNSYGNTEAAFPLHRFTPVEMTVDTSESSLDFYWHVHDLAEDCVNQGGVARVSQIQPPDRDTTTPS